MMTSTRKVFLFVGLSYGLAALMAALMALSGLEFTGAVALVFSAAYMFTPLAAVAVVQRAAGERPLRGLGAGLRLNRWLAVASVGALVLVLVSTLAGFALPWHHFDPGVDALLARFGELIPPEELAEVRTQLEALPIHPALLALPQAVIAGATINALFAFGEEIGWRGLLHRELAGLGLWRESAIVGVLWGFWHAPIILLGHNYPEHPLPGVFLFVVICLLLSPLHTLVRRRSGSVWAAAICHGTFNAAAGAPLLITAGGSDLTVGVTGLAGVLGMGAFNLGLAIWLWRRGARS